jgi:integrase
MRGQIKKRVGKKGDVSWQIIVPLGRDPVTGKYKKKWVTVQGTKKEAEKKLNEMLSLLEKGININPEKITYSEYLDKWLADYGRSNLSLRTVNDYTSLIENHIKPRLGHIPLIKLQPVHLREMYSELLENGRKDNKKTVDRSLSTTTVLHVHRVISETLKHAVQWELVPRNVAGVVNPPRREEKEKPVMSQDKISILLDSLKDTYLYLPTYLAIATGMRLGEVLGLRWTDVDLKAGIIRISQSLGLKRKEEYKKVKTEELPAKGRNETYTKQPKTRGSRRSIDLPYSLMEVLKKHQLQQKKDRLAWGELYQDTGLVCCLQNGQAINPASFSGMFSRKAKKAGVSITFHGIRHSHATWLFQQGEHPKTVSERLGHSKIGITMDLYTHVMPGTQKQAARKIEEMLAGN